MSKYKIFANHAHIYPKECKDNAGIPELKTLMETCGIDKCVCFATFPDRFEEGGFRGSSVEWLAEQIKDDDSLVGFGVIDFNRRDLENQVEEIFDLGFKGIKLHPAYQEFNIMGDEARRVYRKAQEFDLFLSFHTGLHWHRISDYNVLLFDELAYEYPSLRFSMEHIGGYSFFKEALAVMANNSRALRIHVFGGWTTIDMVNGKYHSWTLSDEQLLALIDICGYKTSIFGLDFPFSREERLVKAIERIENLPISDEAKAAILGGNLSRELGVTL